MLDTHQTFLDLVLGYALGALDPADLHAFEQHLQNCRECQQALEQYEVIGQGLLHAAPPVSPPPHLKTNLRTRLGATRAPQPKPQSIFRSLSLGKLAIGLLVLTLLALNLATFVQLRALQQQQSTLAQQLQTSQTALVLVSQPEGQTLQVSGQGGHGSLITSTGHTTGVLFVEGLETLDASKTYQIWLIDADGNPISAGLFRPRPGEVYVAVLVVSSQPITDFSGLGVTVEPEGGVPLPTGPLVLGSEF